MSTLLHLDILSNELRSPLLQELTSCGIRCIVHMRGGYNNAIVLEGAWPLSSLPPTVLGQQ